MSQRDLSWAVPVMRLGFVGRGVVYLVVAGFSLYAIRYGGQAEGTGSALARLEGSAWGAVVLFLIFLGMLAYAFWRWLDGLYDLENYGGGGRGVVARVGMLVTGTVHLGVGFAAFLLLFTGGGGGGGSTVTTAADTVMGWPGGRWLVGAAGAAIIAAGVFSIARGWRETYREELRASAFTTRWNWVLTAGVMAHGAVVAIVGGLVVYAAWSANPGAAGGVEEAFAWLHRQAYGRILVGAVCVGLLGFALFCFVNAAYRIVPKVAGDDIETLAARMKRMAEQAAA